MLVSYVEFNGSKGERLFMNTIDYERYRHDAFIRTQLLNGDAELVTYDHIYVNVFGLIDFVKNIRKYNPECEIKNRVSLKDIIY